MRRFSKKYGSIDVNCVCPDGKAGRTVYLLEPEKVVPGLEDLVSTYSIAIVSVFGMDWDNDLTPWPARNVFKKLPDFGGKADDFQEYLESRIVPDVESEAGLDMAPGQRFLVGISLAGLYALYSATRTAVFGRIASVSGSLWYDGFTEWLEGQDIPATIGKVYLSVGDQEKNSKNQRFASVEKETLRTKEILEGKGIETFFELNPGNHIADGVPRLRKAIVSLLEQ